MNFQNQNGQSAQHDLDYYYNDYADYGAENSTNPPLTVFPPTLSPIIVPPTTQIPERIKTTLPPKFSSLKNNTKPQKKNPSIPPSPSSSGFTFFGVPLPNLNFNLWGNSGRKADRKEDSAVERPIGKSRYKTFPPTEPEIHRGGFVPIPKGEGGFIPIIDPRISNENKERNVTSLTLKTPKNRENATIIRTHEERNRVKHTNYTVEKVERTSIPFKKQPEVRDREELSTASTMRNGPIFLPTPANFQKNPGSFDKPLIIGVEEPNQEADEISVSTEIYKGESMEFEENVKKGNHQRQVASKIIWTTIEPSLETAENSMKETVTATIEIHGLNKTKNSTARVQQKKTVTGMTINITQSIFGKYEN